MLCVSIVLRLRCLGKSAPKNGRARRICCPRCDKMCTTPARESDLEVKIVKNWRARSSFGSWSCQTCTTPARENDLEVKIVKNWHGRSTFWKFKSPKFAPRLRARTIWKSKLLKTEGAGALLEVELDKICTTPARENDLEVKIVKAPGSRDVFWGSKCFSSGRRRNFDTASS